MWDSVFVSALNVPQQIQAVSVGLVVFRKCLTKEVLIGKTCFGMFYVVHC